MYDPTVKQITDAVVHALKTQRMDLELALKLICRAEESARTIHVPMVLSVVDEGGNLVAFHRMDDSLLASISISQAKAYTAAALRISTAEAAQQILPGKPLYGLQQTHPGQFCLFGGGEPVTVNGRCIGGLGVSGGTAEQDAAVAHTAVTVDV